MIDRDGNMFDSTPSGAWIPTAVVLGKTGMAISVRGEAFRLDKARAAQIRPRSRPRYTLAPTMVMKGGQPLMSIGTPGGDNQAQTILQAFLNVVEFWPDWYPNLHIAFERPRLQTLHLFGSPWPHTASFNRLNLEVGIPDSVLEELKARGHDAARVAPFSIASCATAALIDPGRAIDWRGRIRDAIATQSRTEVRQVRRVRRSRNLLALASFLAFEN